MRGGGSRKITYLYRNYKCSVIVTIGQKGLTHSHHLSSQKIYPFEVSSCLYRDRATNRKLDYSSQLFPLQDALISVLFAFISFSFVFAFISFSFEQQDYHFFFYYYFIRTNQKAQKTRKLSFYSENYLLLSEKFLRTKQCSYKVENFLLVCRP